MSDATSPQTKPNLHRDWIDSTALKIVSVLKDSGFECFLVGGCVRDLLIGIHPKDFDIATNARPEEVRRKIPYSFVIGKRFKLVLVKKGSHQFEIATFRRNKSEEDPQSEDGEDMIVGDNYFGTAQEDAQRRDFTINALFYDPTLDKIVDYCQGLNDIALRQIKMIGPAVERLLEDPIRILRAIRLSHKIGFRIESELREGIVQTASSLKAAILPRKREEYLKILKLDDPMLAFLEMKDLGVLENTLPGLNSILSDPESLTIFSHYIDSLLAHRKISEPSDIFTLFLFCVAKALSKDENIDVEKLNADLKFNIFMKDELGMFKQESADFFRALDFMPSLDYIDTYSRKGDRRKFAFLSHDFFHLALTMSYAERSISTDTYYFWIHEKTTRLN